jgi:hypothetical protein
MADVQHKPTFTQSDAAYFPASEPRAVQLVTALRQCGVEIELSVSVLATIEEFLDAGSDERASDFLAILLSRLQGQGRRGRELRAALLSAAGVIDAESLAEQGIKANVTKQTWHRAINRLRARLSKNG